jgi:hypothetical protein
VEKINTSKEVPPSVSGAPPMVEGTACVVVPSHGAVLGVDGTWRVGSARDAGRCPAKEFVATWGISKDNALSSETSTLEQTSA